ncbi:MAG: hypothetical protein JXR76_01330 [Deltaproteobacteria bacterium]|nr:hypothetical protein [Deltaproteobacteria bacterium]
MSIPVIFAHGLSGSPDGKKALLLKENFGATVPSLQSLELPAQAQVLAAAMPATRKSILVGSSLGALAVLGASHLRPDDVGAMVLLAPAFDLERHRHTFEDALRIRPGLMTDAPVYAALMPPGGTLCHVVQGMADELFTIDKAIAFVQRVPAATLTLVHDNHQLEMWYTNLVPLIGQIQKQLT